MTSTLWFLIRIFRYYFRALPRSNRFFNETLKKGSSDPFMLFGSIFFIIISLVMLLHYFYIITLKILCAFYNAPYEK